MNLNRLSMTTEEKFIYREGFKAAARLFAIWKDGKETVGIRGEPYIKFIEEIDSGRYDP